MNNETLQKANLLSSKITILKEFLQKVEEAGSSGVILPVSIIQKAFKVVPDKVIALYTEELARLEKEFEKL